MKYPRKRTLATLLATSLLCGGLIATPALAAPGDLQDQFDTNKIVLDQKTAEMRQLLAAAEDMKTRGVLPDIDIILGFKMNTYDLLKGFVDGINIPLILNIGGIGKLNGAMFANYNYSTILYGSLGFPNGIMNGSNTVNSTSLPGQSLEAQVAAQEYLLYVTDAIVGILRLVAVMDLSDFDVAVLPATMSGAKAFLEFDLSVMEQKRNAMYSLLGPEKVRMGSLLKTDKTVADVIGDSDGGGYNYLVDARNSLLGGQENVDALVEVINYIEKITDGSLLDKYSGIDFTDPDAVDQILGYLIADVTEARDILAKADGLAGSLASLMNTNAEGGLVGMVMSFLGDDPNEAIGVLIDELIASQIPGSLGLGLGQIMNDLLGDIDWANLTTADVLEFLDAAIVALEGMRAGLKEIDLQQLTAFVESLMSGQILDKYLELAQNPDPASLGTLLRYLKGDIDGCIAVLQVADLLETELNPLLGNHTIRGLIVDFLNVALPDVVNEQLDAMVPGAGALGIGEILTEILSPVIMNWDIPTTIKVLQFKSEMLGCMIEVYDRLDRLFALDSSLTGTEWANLMALADGFKAQLLGSIDAASANLFDATWLTQLADQMRGFTGSTVDSIAAIRNIALPVTEAFDRFAAYATSIGAKAEAFAATTKTTITDSLKKVTSWWPFGNGSSSASSNNSSAVYTVTFDPKNGTPALSLQVASGSTVPKPGDPTLEGNTFGGWLKGTTAYNFSTKVTSNLTLSAKWTAITYTVKFDSQGGTAKTAAKVNYGAKVAKPTDPTKAGSTFGGWYLSNAPYSFDAPVYSDITLVAGWSTLTPTVTFDPQNGSAPSYTTVTYNTAVAKPADPVKEGYAFGGWLKGTAAFNFTTKVTADLTLTAKWTAATYTVTFDSQGGTAKTAAKVTYGNKAAKPTDPTKAGYKFNGWTLGGASYDFNTPVTSNLTLTADWAIITYNVIFDAQNGSAVSAYTVGSGSVLTKPADPVKEGYVFGGWLKGTTAFNFTTKVTTDLTLTAKWTPVTYTVTFDSQGGTAKAAAKVSYGNKVAKPTNPTKSKFTFGGWYLGNDLYDFNTPVTGNFTLTARWN